MFYVCRTYTRSHTSKKLLWSVESRLFVRKEEATAWRDFCQKEWNEEHPKYKALFFVVEIYTEEVDGRFNE